MSLARTNPWPYDITIKETKGSYLFTDEYGPMFDFASGIAVNNLGHRNNKILAATERVMDKYAHINVYGEFNIKEQLKYADLLAGAFNFTASEQEEGLWTQNKKVWFCNAGTEANELAMKLATLATGREGFIALENGFHGRSLGSLSLTHKPTYREPFSYMVNPELTKWVKVGEEIPEEYGSRAALFMELVQGEAGVVPVDPTWANYVSDWCEDHGVLLVIDEVQTGFGRTGRHFALDLDDYSGVNPAIVTLGKAAGGGYPLGAVVTSKEIMDYISERNPFTHLSTFGGNPISVAAGRVMFEETRKKELLINVLNSEVLARSVFQDCKHAYLRGKGLMLGLVLDDSIDIDSVVQNIWKKSIFCGRVLYGSNTIRLYAPLNTDSNDLWDKFGKVREAVEQSVK